jgi:hypothetical protein
MKPRMQYALITLICGLLGGCAHHHKPIAFTEEALIAYRDAALEAAISPEEWQRFSDMRITSGPLDFYTTAQNIHYVFYSDRQRIDILITTKSTVEDIHGSRILTTLRVSLDLVTAVVLSMKEEL